MNDINYYEKLKADFPTFGSTLILDGRQQESLKSLLGHTEGALNSYRSECEKSRADVIHSEEHKKGKLNEIKAKCAGAIATEFNHIQDRVKAAGTALHNATHQKPKDTSEELLQFMKSKEIRDGLKEISLAKRTEFLFSGAQEGDAAVLRAVEAQPVISALIPSDVMDRANKVYAGKVAPQQAALAELAAEDLEGATAVRNLAGVEIGRMEA